MRGGSDGGGGGGGGGVGITEAFLNMFLLWSLERE